MAETDYLQEFKSYFTPGDLNDPRVNPDLRRRIAYELMRKQRKAPQNIGEGLTAIGEAIGERRQEGRLAEQEIAAADRADELMKGRPTAAAEGGVVPTSVGVVNRAEIPPVNTGDTPQVFTPPPPPPMNAGQPSPLPPDAAGPMGQPPPTPTYAGPVPVPVPAGTTSSIAGPTGPNPIPMAPRAPMTDPRVREAVVRTLAARGGRPPGPTEAGGQPPAQMPLATPTGGPFPGPASQAPGSNPLNANAQMAALPPTTAGQGIRPAPPAGPPIRVEPREPTPPGRIGLTPTERWAAEVLQKDPYNERLKMRLAPILAQEQANREHQQNVLNKEYERRLKQADPQYQATLSKTLADARKAQEPDLRKREDVEEGTYYDPNTGTYRAARIEGGTDAAARPTFKPSGDLQSKAFVNYGRARLAYDALTEDDENLLATSKGQAALGAFGLRPLQTERYKNADTARENFIGAFVRQQSGADIPNKELEREARAMLPEYGDKPLQLQQKRAQRAQFLGGMESVLGPRGKKAAEWHMEQERSISTAKQKLIDAEMAGIKPERPGHIKEKKDANGRVVARREWTGTHWREL